MRVALVLVLVVLAGCWRAVDIVGEPAVDGGPPIPIVDAAPPARVDAGPPAAADAGQDAGPDAGPPLADRCVAPEVTTFDLTFPARRRDCPWSVNDNLLPEQGLATARVDEPLMAIPADAVGEDLCDFRFEAVSEGLRYDDNIVLHMDGVVLATSDRGLLGDLERDGELFLWDWARVAGRPMNLTGDDPYCLGEARGTCRVPVSDVDDGVLRLDLRLEDYPRLLERIREGGGVLTLVTLGDNDPSTDCTHGEVAFTVEVATP
jgi:hypothetical protein